MADQRFRGVDAEHDFDDAVVLAFGGVVARRARADHAADAQDVRRPALPVVGVEDDFDGLADGDFRQRVLLDFDARDARAVGGEEEERGDVERADAIARPRLTLDDLAGERGDDEAFLDLALGERAAGFGAGAGGAGFAQGGQGDVLAVAREVAFLGRDGAVVGQGPQAFDLALGGASVDFEPRQRGARFAEFGLGQEQLAARGFVVEFGEPLPGLDAVALFGVHPGDDAVALGGEADDAAFDVDPPFAAGDIDRPFRARLAAGRGAVAGGETEEKERLSGDDDGIDARWAWRLTFRHGSRSRGQGWKGARSGAGRW